MTNEGAKKVKPTGPTNIQNKANLASREYYYRMDAPDTLRLEALAGLAGVSLRSARNWIYENGRPGLDAARVLLAALDPAWLEAYDRRHQPKPVVPAASPEPLLDLSAGELAPTPDGFRADVGLWFRTLDSKLNEILYRIGKIEASAPPEEFDCRLFEGTNPLLVRKSLLAPSSGAADMDVREKP